MSESDPVLRRVRDALDERGALGGTRIDAVTVGDAAILVELSGTGGRADAGGDGPRAGLAHRPQGGSAVDWEGTDLGGRIGALDDALTTPPTEDHRFDRAVAVAALNAASAPFVDWRPGDPMARLAADVDTVVTVGLFRPAFRKFDDVDVRVIERDPARNPSRDAGTVDAPGGVAVAGFTPDETAAAMAGADVVFVTGSTLIYGGIERYLASAPASATVVVIGATASLLPAPLFDAGADVVAGASVVDADATRAAVVRGECGTDLHDHGVRKGYATLGRPAALDPDPSA